MSSASKKPEDFSDSKSSQEDESSNKKLESTIADCSITEGGKLKGSNFVPGVSFDTVPLLAGTACEDFDEGHCSDHTLEYTEEEFYDNECSPDFLRPSGNDRLMVPFSHSRSSSPLRGQSGASVSLIDSTMNGLDGIHVGADGRITRTDYPSRPTIVNDALVINRTHKDYSALWLKRKEQIDQRLRSREAHFVFPDILFPPEKVANLPLSDGYTPLSKEERRKALIIGKKIGYPNSPRTILCYISGRKHTWVSLDWLLKRFSQDVDHLVIITNLPKMSNHRSRSRSRSRSTAPRSRSAAPSTHSSSGVSSIQRTLSADGHGDHNKHVHEHWLEWASGYDADQIKETLNNILRYVTTILPDHRAVKVTVEIVIGKLQKIVVDAINVYGPDLIVLSSLRSKPDESLVRWKSNGVNDKICQTLPIPILLVPVKKMLELENEVFNEICECSAGEKCTENCKRPSMRQLKSAPQILKSYSSQKSSSSTNTGKDSSRTIDTSNTTSLDSLMSSSADNDLKTDADLEDHLETCRREIKAKMLDIDNDTQLSSEEKIISKLDSITNASLHFINELDDKGRSTESFEELKRVITGDTNRDTVRAKKSMLDVGNSSMLDVGKSSNQTSDKQGNIQVPTIFFDEDSISPAKKSSQIKFASSVKRNDGKEGHTESKPIERSISYDLSLRPESSQGTNNSRNMDLRKVRSATGIKPTKSGGSSSTKSGKKKSRGFFSFFKGSDSNVSSAVSSPASSRRNSSGSDISGIIMGTPTKQRRSRFFGLKKS